MLPINMRMGHCPESRQYTCLEKVTDTEYLVGPRVNEQVIAKRSEPCKMKKVSSRSACRSGAALQLREVSQVLAQAGRANAAARTRTALDKHLAAPKR